MRRRCRSPCRALAYRSHIPRPALSTRRVVDEAVSPALLWLLVSSRKLKFHITSTTMCLFVMCSCSQTHLRGREVLGPGHQRLDAESSSKLPSTGPNVISGNGANTPSLRPVAEKFGPPNGAELFLFLVLGFGSGPEMSTFLQSSHSTPVSTMSALCQKRSFVGLHAAPFHRRQSTML